MTKEAERDGSTESGDSVEDLLPLTITSIQPQKRNKDRFSLFNEDRFLIGVSTQTLTGLSLRKGMKCTHELYRKLKQAEGIHAIREACLRYLSRRDHASFELKQKLQKKDFETANIELILDEFAEKGWIDDSKFARSFAIEKAELNKWGPKKIRAALYKKGLGKKSIENGIEYAFENLQPHKICVDLALKKEKRFARETDPFKREQKIYRFLASRGFRFEDIKKALPQIVEKLDA
jgi:regulatory protein